MQNTKVPEHVFISFAHADKNQVERIATDLQEAGIPIWVDYEGLTPGTSDWELALREAIERSYAVLLVASPASRQSLAVKGEVKVAQSRNLVIYPLWATGEQWIDCIPLEFSHSQYIDCRSENYRTGLSDAIQQLRQVIEESTPRHYLVSANEVRNLRSSTKLRKPRSRASWGGIDVPPNSVLIELPSANVKERGAYAVIMNLLAYASVGELIDDLYVHYLKDRYSPFTYGSIWVLAESSPIAFELLVDWPWLTCIDKGKYHPTIEQIKALPSLTPLVREPIWTVLETNQLWAYGLAVHEEGLLLVWKHAKRRLYIEGLLEITDIDSFVPSEYEFRAVFGQFVRDGVTDRRCVLRQRAPLTELDMERLFPAVS